ncbi:MAG TPA: DUF1552 domain-containing protein [Polyangiaceae bacterium]|nr:DUF1552 domain-containing protein [Polyangiaceae bacterium]
MLTHWPVGTYKYRFLPPSGSGSTYVASQLTQPFEAAGLRQDMSVFFGFSEAHLRCPGGGGHEAGTPFTTTCCDAPGTRENGGERDDACAGGPSFDQIFLKNVPGLARPGAGYVNAICDARVDSNEISTRCLSYSYQTGQVPSATLAGSTITEHLPLLPTLKPADLYAELFASFMPGGATPDNQRAALVALQLRKSVLDYALTELASVKRLAPASEAPKIESHAAAIRALEQQLTSQEPSAGCELPTAPSPELTGQSGNAPYVDNALVDDSPVLLATAEAHLAILLAAFQCDLTRVATFQFAPGTNHVSFRGLWGNDPNRISMHHPASHGGSFSGGAASADPTTLSEADQARYEFLVNVQVWYNQRLANWLSQLKSTKDAFGESLLDTTVVPYVTEVAQSNNARSPKPAFLFGGRKLGLQHGSFRVFDTVRPQVDLYLSCAQALLQTEDPLLALRDERFVQFNPKAAPIPGLWLPA